MSARRFKLEFISQAAYKEFESLDGSIKPMVLKGLLRLEARADEIGKPLSGDLQGCRELKFRANGLRIIYRIKDGSVQIVQVIAVGARSNEMVFKLATKRVRGNQNLRN